MYNDQVKAISITTFSNIYHFSMLETFGQLGWLMGTKIQWSE